MSFSNDDMRGSHTVRIFGTNKDDDVLHDVWLDIERVDVLRTKTKINGIWHGQFMRLYWGDDPNGEGVGGNPGEGNPSRLTGTLKICSPDEEDQEDPAEWVPVKTIIIMDWKKNTALDSRMDTFSGNRTSGDNRVRIVEARRCFHRDTIIDEEVENAVEQNPDWRSYVVASDQYDWADPSDQDEDKKDENTFIEVQYASYSLQKSSPRANSNGVTQGEQFSLKNIHYLNFTKEAKGPANEQHGFDPPWALDMYQAIVNVQWGGLAVEFGNKDKGPKDNGGGGGDTPP